MVFTGICLSNVNFLNYTAVEMKLYYSTIDLEKSVDSTEVTTGNDLECFD